MMIEEIHELMQQRYHLANHYKDSSRQISCNINKFNYQTKIHCQKNAKLVPLAAENNILTFLLSQYNKRNAKYLAFQLKTHSLFFVVFCNQLQQSGRYKNIRGGSDASDT
jgi:uncharacterized membrane protein